MGGQSLVQPQVGMHHKSKDEPHRTVGATHLAWPTEGFKKWTLSPHPQGVLDLCLVTCNGNGPEKCNAVDNLRPAFAERIYVSDGPPQ